MGTIKKWSEQELEFIKKNYSLKGVKFVANYLNRTYESVKKKAGDLKIVSFTTNKWSQEEIKFLKNNLEKHGVRYVSEHVKHPQSSVRKKAFEFGLKRINKQNTPNIPKNILEKAVQESYCMTDLIKRLNKTSSGTYLKILKRYIQEYNIDTSHFDPFKKHREQVKGISKKFPIEYWLVNGSTIGSSGLKERLYKEGLKERKCEKCGQGEMWNGEKMSLILDHINGVHNDNRLENLRIVCPNCNATLPTHCRGYKKDTKEKLTRKNDKTIIVKTSIIKKETRCIDCNKKISNTAIRCKTCSGLQQDRKSERPSYEVLKQDIQELGYAGTGRKYGVSDNTIRKWMKFYEKYGE